MHFPLNPTIFGIEINTHFIAELLAFFVGYRIYRYLRKNTTDSYSDEQRLVLLIAAALGALLFSRLIGALENHLEWFNHKNPWLYLYSTKTVAGGLMGGWLLVEIVKKFMGSKTSSGDLLTFPIIIGLIIGRVGCFSQGIYEPTFGSPTNFILGMNLGDGINRHPLALYEISLLIFIGLSIYFIQKKYSFREGMKFKLFMFIYLVYRFIAEWMKPHHPLFIGLTSIQIAIIITYALHIKYVYDNFLPILKKK